MSTNVQRKSGKKSQRIENNNGNGHSYGVDKLRFEQIQNLYKSIRGRLCEVILRRNDRIKY